MIDGELLSKYWNIYWILVGLARSREHRRHRCGRASGGGRGRRVGSVARWDAPHNGRRCDAGSRVAGMLCRARGGHQDGIGIYIGD